MKVSKINKSDFIINCESHTEFIYLSLSLKSLLIFIQNNIVNLKNDIKSLEPHENRDKIESLKNELADEVNRELLIESMIRSF